MKSAMAGGGRYDAEVCSVMESACADVVLLIVVGGDRGNGFAVAVNNGELSPGPALCAVPTLLRAIADGIETHQQGGQN